MPLWSGMGMRMAGAGAASQTPQAGAEAAGAGPVAAAGAAKESRERDIVPDGTAVEPSVEAATETNGMVAPQGKDAVAASTVGEFAGKQPSGVGGRGLGESEEEPGICTGLRGPKEDEVPGVLDVSPFFAMAGKLPTMAGFSPSNFLQSPTSANTGVALGAPASNSSLGSLSAPTSFDGSHRAGVTSRAEGAEEKVAPAAMASAEEAAAGKDSKNRGESEAGGKGSERKRRLGLGGRTREEQGGRGGGGAGSGNKKRPPPLSFAIGAASGTGAV